ncbi:EVE domain-containing protein [Geomonas subterranea]|uniref:EVE domain-containing protein n=1 Tax=Geomonas subterranea TaxID=2847989 RepID=UPI001CD5B480|nr:EVE domain-containing protein [Geomonas fuzhouensis]
MVHLLFAENLDDVRASIATFSSEIMSYPTICASLAQTATYWVVDGNPGLFAPAKFAGFQGMDFTSYQAARNEQYSGDAFDGHETRKVIETLANKAFKKSKAAETQLQQWLEVKLGQNAVKHISTAKWKFLELPSRVNYWVFSAIPRDYEILEAVRELEFDRWRVGGHDVKKGDRCIIWKAKGTEQDRGIVAMGEVLSDPDMLPQLLEQEKFDHTADKAAPKMRVNVKYTVPLGLPIWLSDDSSGVLSSLSVSRATGGSIFKVTPAQWSNVMSLIKGSGNVQGSYAVLLKEVGKSQHKDGVRIDKAFHNLFNPPHSPFYTKRGATRKIKVTFNGKDFDAEYRFEGTRAKEVDLQRIGFFKDLREEFKTVFPVPRGTFTIKIGRGLNHFVFDHEQISSETYNKELEVQITKSKKDRKEARIRRLAEAERMPASVQVTSVAYIRNPDVIVEVLDRANGKCEACFQDAPFLRAKDKSPYLEVHHKVPLSAGGEDVVANALAVCPNCHRKMHYG